MRSLILRKTRHTVVAERPKLTLRNRSNLLLRTNQGAEDLRWQRRQQLGQNPPKAPFRRQAVVERGKRLLRTPSPSPSRASLRLSVEPSVAIHPRLQNTQRR